tara:strand:+ start:100 stop:276 length:177 start_codon:yes stop_codon:yes gene_type:complete
MRGLEMNWFRRRAVKRFAKKADKAFGINGYKKKKIKRRKIFSSTPFREGTDDDCGGDN